MNGLAPSLPSTRALPRSLPSAVAGSPPRDGRPGRSVDEILLASRVAPPAPLATWIARPRLLGHLLDPATPQVTALVAPAGYGKSTLLAQWVARVGDGAAWLTLDARDDAPAALARDLDAALAASAARARRTTALVLDNAERVTNEDAIAVALAVIDGLGRRVRVAIALRAAGAWPLARLCASGHAACVTAADLALTADELESILDRSGIDPAPANERAASTVDGWPAGLQLWMAEGTASGPIVREYVRCEVLRDLEPVERQFLVRTSVLDELDAAGCDAILGSEGPAAASRELLDRIDRRHSLFTVPAAPGRYRLPALVRRALRDELARRDPGDARVFAARAAAWHGAEGRPIEAAALAADARDHDALAWLLPAAVRRAIPAGRSRELESVVRSLDGRGDSPLRRDGPVRDRVAAPVALLHAVLGNGADAERWADVAWSAATRSRVRAALGEAALARALVCRAGPARMRADARLALRVLGPRDESIPIAFLLLGVADLLVGDGERAESGLARACAAAAGRDDAWTGAVGFALRASLARSRYERPRAESFVRTARSLVARSNLDGEPAGLAVAAGSARLAATHGLSSQARTDLRLVLARGRVATAIPWLAARTLVDVGATQLALGDPSGAAGTLDELRRLLAARPRLGMLAAEAVQLAEQVRRAEEVTRRGPTLTAAELRLLPYLATDLGMSAIAARLTISTNTIKTEAKSIYRKLAVGRRSEAVDRAIGLGLLEPRAPLADDPQGPDIAMIEPSRR